MDITPFLKCTICLFYETIPVINICILLDLVLFFFIKHIKQIF